MYKMFVMRLKKDGSIGVGIGKEVEDAMAWVDGERLEQVEVLKTIDLRSLDQCGYGNRFNVSDLIEALVKLCDLVADNAYPLDAFQHIVQAAFEAGQKYPQS